MSQGGCNSPNFTAGIGISGGSKIRGVESEIVTHTFKLLVNKLLTVAKQLKTQENMATYSEVRQLMFYIKEGHSNVFKRVALSALLDSAGKPVKKDAKRKPTEHEPKMAAKDTNDSDTLDDEKNKKADSKLTSKSTKLPTYNVENTDVGPDDTGAASNVQSSSSRKKAILISRTSEKTLQLDSDKDKPKSKLKGLVNWFRGSDQCSVDDQELQDNGDISSSTVVTSRVKSQHFGQKLSTKANVAQTLQKATKKVGDHINKLVLKKKPKTGPAFDETQISYASRQTSVDFGDTTPPVATTSTLKERKLVDTVPIRDGLLRLSFFLDTCPPGSVPDAQLLASVLDLPYAKVVAKAAFLLECAYFVHCCNKGQWPAWMKINLMAFRPSGNASLRSSGTMLRKGHIMQRAAGKLFYQWAELIGQRLEEMINDDRRLEGHIRCITQSVHKQRELLTHDEEENFLDEASLHNYGLNGSMALRFVASVLLNEITTFLRETYQVLPKSTRLIGKSKEPSQWDRLYSKDANRRWSMAFSSMGHSQASAQSLQSIMYDKDMANIERKISFVVHEPDESEGSSNTTLGVQQGEEGRKAVPMSRPLLLRRGTSAVPSGSFKRRSLKLTRGTKEGKDVESEWKVPDVAKRADSIQSKRKISLLSDKSDNSECGLAGEQSEEESPGGLSDDPPPESPTDNNEADEITKNMPWLNVMVQVMNSVYYFCLHRNCCHPFCYQRIMRSCTRLMRAVRKVYGDDFSGWTEFLQTSSCDKDKGKGSDVNRKVSEQTNPQDSGSPSTNTDPEHRTPKDKRTKPNPKPNLNSKSDTEKRKKDKANEQPPILKYIKSQVLNGFHSPMTALLKGAVILTDENFARIIPVAWKLLLETDREIVGCAASLFILAAVKIPQQVSFLMHHDLTHSSVAMRIEAILKFQILWKMRYQVWPRMEENAHLYFKVPPPGIEFTLPSPKIGIESLDVVDAPWELFVRTKVEEVTINQERHRSVVTATKTRKKQQTELIRKALQAQYDKKRLEREEFLITSIPITIQAAHEPSLYHAGEIEHEDLDDEQFDGPISRSAAAAAGHHLQSAHSLFPSCLCSAVIQIIHLLDDAAVASNGDAVYSVAYHVIWNCLVEDSALFLRYILERLTREKQEEMFKLLRHLIRFIPKLPQQAAFALYNYIIGYIMFYVRGSHENGPVLIGAALSILWMVVHSVHGIMFKDLKQILRKEQCDASILLTANVPWAKKIIVHGPQDMDSGSIPSQFPIQEDTQFCQILRESLDFFGIDEPKHNQYFLVDYKNRRIQNPSTYVRDVYFFKRSQYPQLQLTYMKEEDAFNELQKEELVSKFVETGKVLLTWAILKNVDMVVQRVVFLHEELMKLPSFPRTALESNLDLYKGGILGKELLGLDVLHKFMWVRLIARMFEAMAGNFAYSGDIHLFLNVLNGSVILHSQDAGILRYVMATYINAAFHFKNIFATNGYLLIMPTLLKIYSNHQTNKLVTTTVEYAVKQFYLRNRKPFILQMFGSLSAMLDTDEEGTFGDAHKIQSSCLFNLLLSLETPSPDPLSIGELVKEEKPLKPIDFCYHDEDEMVTILDCISLCVMVVSYSSESIRGCQMLIILEAILPCYVQHIQLPSYYREGKTEVEILNQLAVCIRTLVDNSEALIKSYNGPYRSSPEHKGASQKNYAKDSYSIPYEFDDGTESKYVPEQCRSKNLYEHDVEDSELLRTEYRRPRDVLLSLVGDFVSKATERLTELNKKNSQDGGKLIEVLNVRSYIRLTDIAHSLLKISPYDPESMGCRGLQHYMRYILPSTDWADDAMKPAFVTILRRLDKVFQKIAKKSSIRRHTDWDAASGLLKGVYDTLVKYPHIIYWQYIRTLINTCQSIVVCEYSTVEGLLPSTTSSTTAQMSSQRPPPNFCSIVVRLISLQLQTNTDSCSLEQICGGTTTFSSQEKTENIIMNLIVPLCLRVGASGQQTGNTAVKMKQNDIIFLVTIVLHAMSPPTSKILSTSGPNLKATMDNRSSLTFAGIRDTKSTSKISPSLYQVAFLALKIIVICFRDEIINVWMKIVRSMRELGKRNEAVPHLWDFLDFIVTHRTPMFILMQPFIFQKLAQPPISDFERGMHTKIREKLRGISLPFPKSRGTLLLELVNELKELKEEIQDQSDLNDVKKQETTVQITNEMPQRQHRPSLIGLLTGEGYHQQKRVSLTADQLLPTIALSTSTSQMPLGNHSADVDSSAIDSRGLTTGETSTTPLSPASPSEDTSIGELHPTKSRLQRIKPQSRKTFRTRKGRRNSATDTIEGLHRQQQERRSSHVPIESSIVPTLIETSCVTATAADEEEVSGQPKENVEVETADSTQPGLDPHRLRIATCRSRPLDGGGSWDEDSAVSYTSSTSGYRESYPVVQLGDDGFEATSPAMRPPLASPDIQDLPSTSSAATTTTNNNMQDDSSPECSLSGNGERRALLQRSERVPSEQSLLMSFEQDDETTLI